VLITNPSHENYYLQKGGIAIATQEECQRANRKKSQGSKHTAIRSGKRRKKKDSNSCKSPSNRKGGIDGVVTPLHERGKAAILFFREGIHKKGEAT